jgi:hypothetical protein
LQRVALPGTTIPSLNYSDSIVADVDVVHAVGFAMLLLHFPTAQLMAAVMLALMLIRGTCRTAIAQRIRPWRDVIMGEARVDRSVTPRCVKLLKWAKRHICSSIMEYITVVHNGNLRHKNWLKKLPHVLKNGLKKSCNEGPLTNCFLK